jgi:chromosome segregation ATPase
MSARFGDRLKEFSRKLVDTEAKLERVTSENEALIEEVIDLKGKKECLEAKLEQFVKILGEEKFAQSEFKANIEDELKRTTEEYQRICVQLEEHKVTSSHEINNLLQECSALRAAKESTEVQLQTLEAKYTEHNEAKKQVEEQLKSSIESYQ